MRVLSSTVQLLAPVQARLRMWLFCSSLLATLKPLVLYVDPSTERLHLVPSLERRGCEYVFLHSTGAVQTILEANQDNDDADLRERVLAHQVPLPGEEAEWAKESLGEGWDLCAVLCGSDGGLADAERLQHALLPERSNGINPARRDKYLMNEALRAGNLPAARQCAPASWAEAEAFLRDTMGSRYPVVVKPRRGQASVLVGLADSEEQAKHMDSVLRDQNVRVSIDSSEKNDANVVLQVCACVLPASSDALYFLLTPHMALPILTPGVSMAP